MTRGCWMSGSRSGSPDRAPGSTSTCSTRWTPGIPSRAPPASSTRARPVTRVLRSGSDAR